MALSSAWAEDKPDDYHSHPPLRRAPAPANRQLTQGPAFFVDVARGDDQAAGGLAAPWKSITHALTRVKAGDTLYLRGGVYHENVRISLIGRQDAPITIASFPGEQAVIDGGMSEFQASPVDCWEPDPQGVPGEFRSRRPYPNLRNVVASFGDSMVGLHTYYHAKDLRAADEFSEQEPDQSDIKPIYCGPGLWYDQSSGYLHARLAPTTLAGFDNYQGETDPRKLPLVIAPFRSLPLHLDRTGHFRLQDLVIRGGGYGTVLIDQSSDIEFDNVTIWCGTYGMRAKGAQRLRLHRCGFYGNSPPWQTRQEAGLNSYPGRTTRDITRQNTHAWLVPEANGEFDVYAFPFNDDWEIAYCEFGDAGADGLYLGGVSLRFHHNLVDNTTDDGIYLSPMYARPEGFMGKATLYLYQNYFSRALTMLAFGGQETLNNDQVYFYRNVVDLRVPVKHGRPSEKGGAVASYAGKLMGDHGSPPWPSMFTYQNTFVAASTALSSDMRLLTGATADRPRRMFNNILVHGEGWLPLSPGTEFAHSDGNLYWRPGLDSTLAAEFFAPFRSSPAFESSKRFYAPGFDVHSLVMDPQFVKFAFDWTEANDYRLQSGSPAVDAGVAVPSDWPDTLREVDKGRPDIGALPLGAEQFSVGRAAAAAP